MNTHLQTSSEKVSDIQALRGVAILAVLVYHLSLLKTLFNLNSIKLEVSLYLGVNLFFVISGYVVMLTLIRSQFDIKKFAVRRLYRLYPTIIVFILIAGIINLIASKILHDNSGLLSLFFLPWHTFAKSAVGVLGGIFDNIGGEGFSYGAMWSLSVEMQFYLFIAILCLIGTQLIRISQKNLVRVLAVVLSISYAAMIYYRLSIYFTQLPAADFIHTHLRYIVAHKFDFIVLGVLLALFKNIWDFTLNIPPKMAAILFNCCLILPVIVCAFCESPLGKTTTFLTAFGYTFAGISFTIAVAIAAFNSGFKNTNKIFYRFLIATGERSYGLYVLHFPLFIVAWLLLRALIPNIAFQSDLRYAIWQMISFVVIAIPVVELTYRYVELPWIERGKSRGVSKPRAVTIEKLVTESL